MNFNKNYLNKYQNLFCAIVKLMIKDKDWYFFESKNIEKVADFFEISPDTVDIIRNRVNKIIP